jgi:hypothetical protein
MSARPDPLAALQRRFLDATAPGGVPPAELLAEVGGGALSPAERLAIHANHRRIVLTQALADNFPATLSLLGGRVFAQAARRYLELHPPRDPRLSWCGAELPGFLASYPPARAVPCLADVARLEWALVRVADAPEMPHLDPSRLGEMPPDLLPDVRLCLVPALALVASTHPVDAIWEAVAAGSDEVRGMDGAEPVRLVVHRDDEGDARAMRVDAGTFAALAALARGRTLLEAADAARTADPHHDFAGTLAFVLSHRLVTAIEFTKGDPS